MRGLLRRYRTLRALGTAGYAHLVSRIFIQHYKKLCRLLRLRTSESGQFDPIVPGLCGILDADFGECSFYEVG